MDDLCHAALKTPAPKQCKLVLDEKVELLGDYKLGNFKDEQLADLSNTVRKDHTFY